MQETFNLQNTILQTCRSHYDTLLTEQYLRVTMRVTYADNTILNTVTYRKYNYLHYGLLTLSINNTILYIHYLLNKQLLTIRYTVY